MIGYLALGSNIGDTFENLKTARKLLQAAPEITVLASSCLYETEPYGYKEQPKFLNAVLKIETQLTGPELLTKTQGIEKEMGRQRKIHWGPRNIDIDILLLGNEQFHTEQLTIPHVELTKRSFVLIPLQDVYEEQKLRGKTLADWIKVSGNAAEVQQSRKVW
ncbi:2-amino-4-hydroxy-6-hydroxymethyldihydropteridine diphosphokinase [Enterococcus faecalis]